MPSRFEQMLSKMTAEKLSSQSPEVLGTIPMDQAAMSTDPQGPTTQWATPEGSMSLSEGPPPWEMEDTKYTLSDARRFLDAPTDATLRWVNPRLVEQTGWEHWRPVLPQSDTRFTLKIPAMLCVDGTVRRDGAKGDILAWMPTHWVVSRRAIFRKKTADQTQTAMDRQEALKEDFKRGKYGPNVSLEEARHPTHTMFEGRSVTDL